MKGNLTITTPKSGCDCSAFVARSSSLIIAIGLVRKVGMLKEVRLSLFGHHEHDSDTAVELPRHICLEAGCSLATSFHLKRLIMT